MTSNRSIYYQFCFRTRRDYIQPILEWCISHGKLWWDYKKVLQLKKYHRFRFWESSVAHPSPQVSGLLLTSTLGGLKSLKQAPHTILVCRDNLKVALRISTLNVLEFNRKELSQKIFMSLWYRNSIKLPQKHKIFKNFLLKQNLLRLQGIYSPQKIHNYSD